MPWNGVETSSRNREPSDLDPLKLRPRSSASRMASRRTSAITAALEDPKGYSGSGFGPITNDDERGREDTVAQAGFGHERWISDSPACETIEKGSIEETEASTVGKQGSKIVSCTWKKNRSARKDGGARHWGSASTELLQPAAEIDSQEIFHPCTFVWGKVPDRPWWPAEVVETGALPSTLQKQKKSEHTPVKFIGIHESRNNNQRFALLTARNIQSYAEHLERFSQQNISRYEGSYNFEAALAMVKESLDKQNSECSMERSTRRGHKRSSILDKSKLKFRQQNDYLASSGSVDGNSIGTRKRKRDLSDGADKKRLSMFPTEISPAVPVQGTLKRKKAVPEVTECVTEKESSVKARDVEKHSSQKKTTGEDGVDRILGCRLAKTNTKLLPSDKCNDGESHFLLINAVRCPVSAEKSSVPKSESQSKVSSVADCSQGRVKVRNLASDGVTESSSKLDDIFPPDLKVFQKKRKKNMSQETRHRQERSASPSSLLDSRSPPADLSDGIFLDSTENAAPTELSENVTGEPGGSADTDVVPEDIVGNVNEQEVLDMDRRGSNILDPQDSKPRMEYLVKWVGQSHIHNKWIDESSLKVLAKRKLDNYKVKYGNALTVLVEERWSKPHRIIAHRMSEDSSDEVLVKWCGLPYDECTWESIDEPVIANNSHLIQEFEHFESIAGKVEKLSRVSSTPIEAADVRPGDIETLTEQPLQLKGGSLFPHQMEALNWLRKCWHRKKNVILADEMGLGKTISAASFILSVYHEFKVRKPCLVLVPLSTMPNWSAEFSAWAPSLNIIEYHGSAKARAVIREHEWCPAKRAKSNKGERAFKFNVMLTTYEMIIADASQLRAIPWEILIVDEGHRLKNSASKLFHLLNTFKFSHRILLTGTPLQNNIGEMYSLLNFLQPDTFTSLSDFEEKFNDLSTAEQMEELKKLVAPHMLRRLKKDAMKNIPPKTERVVPVDLTFVQSEYYRALLTRNYQILRQAGKTGQQQSMLNIVMQLRKVCNHPYLIPGTEPEGGTAEFLQEMRIKASAKLSLLHLMLKKLKEDGHRVLIFSQMTKLLDILEDYLTVEFGSKSYERVDGSITVGDRQSAICRFNTDTSRFVFLLSTRSCGLGINLATADTVIIYDSDFNPHADIQAMNRAHRIGQTKRLLVYRLVVRASVEERILQLAKKKLMLDHLFANKTGSQKEVEDILRWGTEELFQDCPSQTDETVDISADDGLETRDAKQKINSDDADGKPRKRVGGLGDVYEDTCHKQGRPTITWDDTAIARLLDRSELNNESTDGEAESDMLGSLKAWDWNEQDPVEDGNDVPLKDGESECGIDPKSSVFGAAHEENDWDKLLRKRWEKMQNEEEAVLGRGKRTRKTVSYKENLNLAVQEVSNESGHEEEEDQEPEYTPAGRALKNKLARLRARQKERIALRNQNPEDKCCDGLLNLDTSSHSPEKLNVEVKIEGDQAVRLAISGNELPGLAVPVSYSPKCSMSLDSHGPHMWAQNVSNQVLLPGGSNQSQNMLPQDMNQICGNMKIAVPSTASAAVEEKLVSSCSAALSSDIKTAPNLSLPFSFATTSITTPDLNSVMSSQTERTDSPFKLPPVSTFSLPTINFSQDPLQGLQLNLSEGIGFTSFDSHDLSGLNKLGTTSKRQRVEDTKVKGHNFSISSNTGFTPGLHANNEPFPWTEEELDALWVGVRRHGKGNWAAMLADHRLCFSKYRTMNDLAQRWKQEELKLFGEPPDLSENLKRDSSTPLLGGSWRDGVHTPTKGSIFNFGLDRSMAEIAKHNNILPRMNLGDDFSLLGGTAQTRVNSTSANTGPSTRTDAGPFVDFPKLSNQSLSASLDAYSEKIGSAPIIRSSSANTNVLLPAFKSPPEMTAQINERLATGKSFNSSFNETDWKFPSLQLNFGKGTSSMDFRDAGQSASMQTFQDRSSDRHIDLQRPLLDIDFRTGFNGKEAGSSQKSSCSEIKGLFQSLGEKSKFDKWKAKHGLTAFLPSTGEEGNGKTSASNNLPHWLREAFKVPNPPPPSLPPNIAAISQAIDIAFRKIKSLIPDWTSPGPAPVLPQRNIKRKKKRKKSLMRHGYKDMFHDKYLLPGMIIGGKKGKPPSFSDMGITFPLKESGALSSSLLNLPPLPSFQIPPKGQNEISKLNAFLPAPKFRGEKHNLFSTTEILPAPYVRPPLFNFDGGQASSSKSFNLGKKPLFPVVSSELPQIPSFLGFDESLRGGKILNLLGSRVSTVTRKTDCFKANSTLTKSSVLPSTTVKEECRPENKDTDSEGSSSKTHSDPCLGIGKKETIRGNDDADASSEQTISDDGNSR